MNEKDLLEQLKTSAEQITPPESLSPENIEKMLVRQNASAGTKHAQPSGTLEQNTSSAASSSTTEQNTFSAASDSTTEQNASSAASGSTRNTGRKKRRFSVYRLGGLAAAFAVAIIGSWQAGRLSVNQDINSASDITVLETGAETETIIPETESAAKEEAALAETAAERSRSDAADTTEASEPLAAADASQPESQTEAPEPLAERAVQPVKEVLVPAKDYETVYQALYDAFGSQGSPTGIVYDTGAVAEMSVDTAADAASGALNFSASQLARNPVSFGSSNAAPSYSTTNVQEKGVDEGDFVKTDGKYIYILKRSGSLVIVDAADGKVMAAVSQAKLNLNEQPREMYVDGDRLSLITSEYYSEMDTSDENVISAKSGYRTRLYTYDISDRETPVLAGSFYQDGSYSQSRKNGNYIYLFSQFTPTVLDTYEASEIIPRTSSGKIAASAVYLPERLSYSSYLVVSSIDITDPEKAVDQKAVVSVPSTFYVSQENIYIANSSWNGADTYTDLMKLHYADGSITGTAAGSLKGYLNDSFSLNEYNGYLRAVTTSYDENYVESNGLYVLDQDLKTVGAILDLAPDETVRSARFFGDTGYFVTFRQMDPLFSVDLSDPENPRILGDLKISGFSTYLHFYSDTLLLGLGYEADPNTGVQTGLKLSVFDISDPSDVKEISKLVLGGITWCSSLDDYKSILIDPEKNIFGFTCDDRYLVFSYDEKKGFVKEFIYDFYNDIINAGISEHHAPSEDSNTNDNPLDSAETETSASGAAKTDTSLEANQEPAIDPGFSFGYGYSDDSTTRGLYIGDVLYLVRPNAVTSFDMSDGYQELGHLILK